jgi:TrmH family RNA methyltransferase
VTAPDRLAPETITSAANPAIAFVRSLARRDRRAAEQAFVVEGVRAVDDALAAGATPRLVLLRQERSGPLPPNELKLPAGVPVRVIERRLFDRLSDVQSPQGVLAVFPFPDLRTDLTVAAPLALVLDRLRDPGNLGTLLRTAAGAGVSAVYLSPETVDPWNPKVVRAAMGAHFRVPIAALDEPTMMALRERVALRVVARGDATLPYDGVDWTGPAALVIGGEAEGVGADLASWSNEAVGIPLVAGVESLNAAVAGAVILFEAARQRRLATATEAPEPSARLT